MRGNPHAAFDVAGAGNVGWSRWCDTRRRKGETTGNGTVWNLVCEAMMMRTDGASYGDRERFTGPTFGRS